jgi:hypothetical protein
MNTENEKLRWIELQFYFILYDIWNIRQNFSDILEFTKIIKIFNRKIDQSKICSLAQDALMNGKLKMNTDEYMLLCWKNYVPLRVIRKYNKKIYSQSLNRNIKHYKENPDDYFFYPKNSKEDDMLIKQFVEAVEKMKGVGITWTMPFTKNAGHYLKDSASKHYHSATMLW